MFNVTIAKMALGQMQASNFRDRFHFKLARLSEYNNCSLFMKHTSQI